ncbi:GDSL esterase/lipase At1g73610-like [Castanea sativa]|uniref:GDSL esterase/lipase At1g73610-like n=1 Tax=Castanea sativa TaxID=21020 RepID=UPI003F6528A8
MDWMPHAAEALGIKDIVPAYLKPDLQSKDLLTSVGFASGGSGIDLLTSSTLGVVAMSQQLQYFKDYIAKLTEVAGEEKAKANIANSLVLMSVGKNDIGVSYTSGAQMYNNLLKVGIASLQSKHSDAKLVFFDIFTPLDNITGNPQQFGAQANITFSAIFSFGDSILDTGMNNNLLSGRCNYPPYGRDFPGKVATGRFCNGKNPTDLIAKALGIKDTVPAYLKPNLQSKDLLTGVGFAAGGSGIDPLTSSTLGVVAMSQQLQYFKDYIAKLTGVAGEEKAKAIIANSLVLMSAGNNDIGVSYTSSARKLQYTFPAYCAQLVTWSTTFLEQLYALGARRFGVLSTVALGCEPSGRVVGSCSITANVGAQTYNNLLKAGIASLQSKHSDAKLVFFDIFTPLDNIASNPQQFGFQNANLGCCGGVGSCLPFTTLVCPNASTYVFWDSLHPTEKTYRIVVSDVLNKTLSSFS